MNNVIERIIRDFDSINIEEIIKKDIKKKNYKSKVNDLEKNKEKDKSQEHFLKYEWSWII